MSNENKIINKIFPDTSNKNDLKYDNIGLYSITLPEEADKISQIILEQNNNNSFGNFFIKSKEYLICFNLYLLDDDSLIFFCK